MRIFSAIVAFPFFATGFVGGFLARAFWGGCVTGWYIIIQVEAQAVVEEVELRRLKKIEKGLTEQDLVL
jgi:hypothetical protein